MVGRKIQISGTLDFSEKKHILIPGLKKFFSFISLVWKIIVTSILWLEEKFKFLELSISWEETHFELIPGLKKFFSFISLVWRIIVTSILWLEEKFKFLDFPEERKKEKEEDNLRYLKNLNLN